MSSNTSTQKWLQSTRGLPGSFMNENHHTMKYIWKGDDTRQQGITSENQSSSNYMSHEQQHDHLIQQNNEMDDLNLLGQEPQRSILGPHNDEFQSQQVNFPNESDHFSRPKESQRSPPIAAMFPHDHLAGGLHKIDQDPPPHTHKPRNIADDAREEIAELGNDPDPATRAAFQSASKSIASSNKKSDPTDEVLNNRPFVATHLKKNDGLYEVMPATYVDDSQSSEDSVIKTPTTLPQHQADIDGTEAVSTTKHDILFSQKSELDHQQGQNSSGMKADIKNDTNVTCMMNTGKHLMEEETPTKTNSKQQQSSLRGDHTIQNSLGGVGDKYKKNQDLAEPAGAKINDEIGDKGDQQQNTVHDDLNSGYQRSQHQSEPTFSQVSDVDSCKMEGHRRSSFTHSIGKLFGLNHKSG
ncbi:hypothetical protein BCR42DRAFT_129936 [Absidia repens]|uniref:Uncharacterized protein n=1 Tax=Absidia repens TaxID=90262 RepID=A0A1X2IVS2_9FUNG|nr:hypothetical protein BCR42DRAFT_129936 [Absidia repens]